MSAGQPVRVETARWEAEKAPDDDSWLQMEPIGSGWLWRLDKRPLEADGPRVLAGPSVRCRPPMRWTASGPPHAEPDGTLGDAWICPDCGRLWYIVRWDPHDLTLSWEDAPWQWLFKPLYRWLAARARRRALR